MRQVSLGELHRGDLLRPSYRIADQAQVSTPKLVRQINGSIEVTARDSQPPFRIHLTDLDRLQVERGRDWRRGIALGATLGSLGGAVAGMLCNTVCSESSYDKFAPVFGLGVGLSLGAGVGVLVAPRRWVDVRLR